MPAVLFHGRCRAPWRRADSGLRLICHLPGSPSCAKECAGARRLGAALHGDRAADPHERGATSPTEAVGTGRRGAIGVPRRPSCLVARGPSRVGGAALGRLALADDRRRSESRPEGRAEAAFRDDSPARPPSSSGRSDWRAGARPDQACRDHFRTSPRRPDRAAHVTVRDLRTFSRGEEQPPSF